MRERVPPGPMPAREVDIGESVSHLLDEARMLIPGVQTLFGFQVVIVFTDRFASVLSAAERLWHLAAIACSVATLVLLLSPAMLHRQRESGWATQGFVNASSRLLAAATLPLGIGLAIDFGIVVRVVTESVSGGVAAAVITLLFVAALWYAVPRSERFLRLIRR